MNKLLRFPPALACLITAGLLFISFSVYADYTAPTLFPFEIEDQFKSVHTDKSFTEALLIFVTADREGSNFSRQWGDTINAYFKEQIEHPSFKSVPVASLLGMPKLMRGMVRRMMRKAVDNDENAYMFMDWDNLFHIQYALMDDAANILIFDRDRKLIFKKAVFELTDEGVIELFRQFDELFK